MGREKVNSQLSSAISSALGNSSACRTQEPPGHRGTIPCQGGLRVNPHNELRSATMCFSPSGSESCTVVPMDIAQAAFNLNSHPAIFYIPEAGTKIIETASEKTLSALSWNSPVMPLFGIPLPVLFHTLLVFSHFISRSARNTTFYTESQHTGFWTQIGPSLSNIGDAPLAAKYMNPPHHENLIR